MKQLGMAVYHRVVFFLAAIAVWAALAHDIWGA